MLYQDVISTSKSRCKVFLAQPGAGAGYVTVLAALPHPLEWSAVSLLFRSLTAELQPFPWPLPEFGSGGPRQ
ncbi:hypothetical protein H206_05310 [Candidatus Electrothrix aarhusensis]|uniref:Uncharacterized protein n=1 Tax=Candidatus Electrothrix aarhusensis TaxID=1859131 RepID=A0A444J4W6_9BACT|nr:hypothetical protein H206_05310 [Candidatus Electrothrix aarhusensis]